METKIAIQVTKDRKLPSRRIDYGSEMAETHPVLETVLDQNVDKDQEIQLMQEDPFPDKAEESPSEKQPCCQDMTLDGDDNQSSSTEKLSQGNPTFILQDSNVNPITENITKMQEKLRKSNKKIETLKRKLKTSQQRSRRLKKKVFSLKEVVHELRKKDLISTDCEHMLNQTFTGLPLAITKRMVSKKKSQKGCAYSPELKSFALTLQFYSAKAYSFVRKTFNLALPSQSQIRRWYSKVPADPGFTEPAFNALKLKSEEAKKHGK